MKIDLLGKIYTGLMSLYFMVSGLNALLDIDTKLARIGLSAIDMDGKVAFILIYCSLMVAIGVSILVIYHLSKTWLYSAALAVTVITSFISFRIIGSIMIGEMSSVQMLYIAVELIEAGIGFLLIKNFNKAQNTRN